MFPVSRSINRGESDDEEYPTTGISEVIRISTPPNFVSTGAQRTLLRVVSSAKHKLENMIGGNSDTFVIEILILITSQAFNFRDTSFDRRFTGLS